MIALWFGMIVPDACALSPPRNACRETQAAREEQPSSSECHMQVVGVGFRRMTDSSLDDGVEKRRVCVQGCVQKVCHRNGHGEGCMYALIIFATNPEYAGLHDRVRLPLRASRASNEFN